MEMHTDKKDGACPATPPGRAQGMCVDGGGQAHDRCKREESGGYHDTKRRTVCGL